jgi:hypothetical protein
MGVYVAHCFCKSETVISLTGVNSGSSHEHQYSSRVWNLALSPCHQCKENNSHNNIQTRCDKKLLRLIFLLVCGYTSGHPCLQGGVLELPLSVGQGMVPAHLSVLCELGLNTVVYLLLVIVRAVWDVRRSRATRVQQVFCETGKKWCRDTCNVANCLRWAVFESCSHFQMVQEI